MEKNSEDALLIERAYALCGGHEGLGADFPWEASYITRVKRGEKPMADPLRWALKKIIAEKEKAPVPIREESPRYFGPSWVKVELDPMVLEEAKQLAGLGHDSLNSIIQSAVIRYIAEYKGKDTLTIFRPAFLLSANLQKPKPDQTEDPKGRSQS